MQVKVRRIQVALGCLVQGTFGVFDPIESEIIVGKISVGNRVVGFKAEACVGFFSRLLVLTKDAVSDSQVVMGNVIRRISTCPFGIGLNSLIDFAGYTTIIESLNEEALLLGHAVPLTRKYGVF